jgi:hypothetical protein
MQLMAERTQSDRTKPNVPHEPMTLRHARLYAGHPRLPSRMSAKKDVDGRDEPGHDEFCMAERIHHPLVPAKAGTQESQAPNQWPWIPACAGMSGGGGAH